MNSFDAVCEQAIVVEEKKKIDDPTVFSRRGFLDEKGLDSYAYDISTETSWRRTCTEGTLRLNLDDNNIWVSAEEAKKLSNICLLYASDYSKSEKIGAALIKAREEVKND